MSDAAPDTEPDVVGIQRRIVRALASAQIIGTVGLGVIPSVGVLLAGQITESEVWAGLALAGSTVGAAVAGVPLALLAASRGRNRALSTGWLIAAVGALLLVGAAQWDSVAILVAGLVLTGVGTAAQFQARFAATDLASRTHRGRALAIVVWVGSIGSMLGPNLGTPGAGLAGSLGLAPLGGAFVVAAVALAVASVLTALLLRPDPLLTARRRSDPAVLSGSNPGSGRSGSVQPAGGFRAVFRDGF
ncbi:MFS transporter, partial [Goodfellowiella coeruleoviolacea]|uniref:MFS transporter n=1 Tax=Goodfellowiella coeruleoviolacea TaxID=334858 RepID=UPI0020A2A1A7